MILKEESSEGVAQGVGAIGTGLMRERGRLPLVT